MSIEATLRSELTAALKARDLRTANVIRMINTKVTERRTAKDFQGEVDDALYLDVITAYCKSLEKAMVQYQEAGERGRENLQELRFDTAYLQKFLPAKLSEAEIRAAVKAAISETGATDAKMSGRVVGAVMKKHKGVVDPATVKRIVAEEL